MRQFEPCTFEIEYKSLTAEFTEAQEMRRGGKTTGEDTYPSAPTSCETRVASRANWPSLSTIPLITSLIWTITTPWTGTVIFWDKSP